MQNIAYEHEDDKHKLMTPFVAMRNFFLLRQKEDMSDTEFLEAFTNSADALEQIGGDALGADEILINDDEMSNKIDPDDTFS